MPVILLKWTIFKHTGLLLSTDNIGFGCIKKGGSVGKRAVYTSLSGPLVHFESQSYLIWRHTE